jgi:hypothetical protein
MRAEYLKSLTLSTRTWSVTSVQIGFEQLTTSTSHDLNEIKL